MSAGAVHEIGYLLVTWLFFPTKAEILCTFFRRWDPLVPTQVPRDSRLVKTQSSTGGTWQCYIKPAWLEHKARNGTWFLGSLKIKEVEGRTNHSAITAKLGKKQQQESGRFQNQFWNSFGIIKRSNNISHVSGTQETNGPFFLTFLLQEKKKCTKWSQK